VNLIEDGLKMADEFGAAAAAVPVKDTIKLADSGKWVKKTLQRNKLWAVQTPQIFNFDLIAEAYENLAVEVTDDATAVERLAHEVKLYMGDYRNIKVTTREDLALARIIAREWKQKN
jgi:2-C-methyl-D-erythritol 4-phosphate cytidylyltransferase